jgi:hypothetical protein
MAICDLSGRLHVNAGLVGSSWLDHGPLTQRLTLPVGVRIQEAPQAPRGRWLTGSRLKAELERRSRCRRRRSGSRASLPPEAVGSWEAVPSLAPLAPSAGETARAVVSATADGATILGIAAKPVRPDQRPGRWGPRGNGHVRSAGRSGPAGTGGGTGWALARRPQRPGNPRKRPLRRSEALRPIRWNQLTAIGRVRGPAGRVCVDPPAG